MTRKKYLQFFDRLDFQTKINLVTLVMVLFVVIVGGIAIDRLIVPAMERDVQDEAWRITRGILGQIQDFPDHGKKEEVAARLALIFQVRAKLLYVEVFDEDGKPAYWVGEEKYRAREDGAILEEDKKGSLSRRRVPPGNVVYEVFLRNDRPSSTGGYSMVRVGVSGQSVQRLSRYLFRTLFTLALLIVGLSFFLTRWFAQMITRPVERLLRMTHLLARGQLEKVIEEVPERPPCWHQPRQVSFAESGKVPWVCPLLSEENHRPAAVLRPPDAPCSQCDAFEHSRGDELSRLLFAFLHMAAAIRAYQEQLRQRYEFEDRLLNACPDGIMANDRQGRIILYNKGAERLLGYSPQEALGHLSVRQVYQPGEARAIKKALLSADYGGEGVLLDYSTQVVRKSGELIPIRLSATFVHTGAEETAVVGYFHDLTELNEHMNALVATNERLNEANKELARLNHRYLEMLGFVTHELKSPIANSYMSANALRQEIFGDLALEQKIMVEAICRNLDQSMEMIRHYLDLSRIEKDEMPVHPQPTRLLRDVVDPVLKGLSGMILDNAISVAVEVPPEMEWTLDPELFRGVFTNLVNNAVKYGEKSGKIRISITDLGDRCRMEVWNSGQGIRLEDQDKLFRKFQRLQNSRQSSVRGTGLGLFITRTVIERHGGRIWVESCEGEWANFIIELPRPQP